MMRLKIDQEFHDLIPRLSPEERQGLEENIKANGCRVSLDVWGNIIVDGHNRYDICVENGIEFQTTNIEFSDRNEAKVWIIRNQFDRRNLNVYQRSKLALELKPLIAAEAKAHQGTRMDILPKSAKSSAKSIDTREEIAKAAGVGHNTIAKVELIEQKATPEQKEQLEKGVVSVNAVHKAIKKDQRRQAVIEQIVESELIADGKYRVIYADPPWRYDNKGMDDYGHAERHFPTMSVDELCALPIKRLSTDDAVLFLWVTSPMLPIAFSVIDAWGFQYKASFVWDKVKHNYGHYNSVRHEFLLLATRGSCLPDVKHLVDSVQEIERSEIHSEKPAEFRLLIDDIYPHGKRIELFARQKAAGWAIWGNQTGTGQEQGDHD